MKPAPLKNAVIYLERVSKDSQPRKGFEYERVAAAVALQRSQVFTGNDEDELCIECEEVNSVITYLEDTDEVKCLDCCTKYNFSGVTEEQDDR